MHEYPTQRQTQIVHWLSESQTLSVEELVLRLNVSVMTVHRDLDALVNMGVVRKFHGGVSLLAQATQPATLEPTCRLCHTTVTSRTPFTIHLTTGEQIFACCPHCGLLMLNTIQNVESALAKDFIYGRAVNVFQGAFLLGSGVAVCCEPSVLCFGSMDDAQKFSTGFGGRAMPYSDAVAYLSANHRGTAH